MIDRGVFARALAALLATASLAFAQPARFEQNQTRRTAVAIEPGLHKGIFCNEEDWFHVDVPRGHRVEVQVRFDHAAGDLELLLVDSRGKNLAWSRGAQSEEVASFTPAQPTRVFIRVYNANNTY